MAIESDNQDKNVAAHDRMLPVTPVAVPDVSESKDSPSSKMLGEFLTLDGSDLATQNQRRAANQVLEHLLVVDQDQTQDKELGPIEAAKRAFDVSKCPSHVEACEFAGTDYHSSETEKEPSTFPIPANEEARVAAIEHLSLHDVVNVPELNVICSLAAAEVNCPHGIVTLVERDIVTIAAANDSKFWTIGSGNPRAQTFCQHFVMDDKPLLVHHAEADKRFGHIAPVKMLSLQFYSGFPITVSWTSKPTGQSEKVIVGALCCLDVKPHDMTRSQYWRLKKLADAASSILEKSANEYIANNGATSTT